MQTIAVLVSTHLLLFGSVKMGSSRTFSTNRRLRETNGGSHVLFGSMTGFHVRFSSRYKKGSVTAIIRSITASGDTSGVTRAIKQTFFYSLSISMIFSE
ncbi:hypothetical protein PsorP6_011400 [Peronosclerospora sorghi]|uniref:Uncharacterized protein n=1 Tax=Peronosclerospora sorghi TaxID=230839 RepID=A0ACC0WJR8_9STRA|nr:hypothetical protein PsorP6_011400 [Peronosclerospora sorghi]